jgi:hypothetical protein
MYSLYYWNSKTKDEVMTSKKKDEHHTPIREITWEELIVLRRYITIDDVLKIRDNYPEGSVGRVLSDDIIEKWTELAKIQELLEKEYL